jgi:hypothetical protein
LFSTFVLPQRGDGVGHGHGSARDFGMQQFDHASVELDRALAFVLG